MTAASTVRISEVLHALFENCDGVVEFRAFGPPGLTGRLFAHLQDLDTIRTFWVAHQQENLFRGVATRRDDHDGTLENCLQLPALFADCDFKRSSEQDV